MTADRRSGSSYLDLIGMEKAGQFDSIPIIDMLGWFSADNRSKGLVAEEVKNACLTSGFMYLRNHGMSQKVIANATKAAEDLFSLSLNTKLSIHDDNLGYYRGYIPIDGESTDPENSGDLKEAFDVGLQIKIDDPQYPGYKRMSAPNLWPEDLPHFRSSVEAYFEAAMGLAKTLFRLFAVSLNLNENHFDSITDMPIAQMRLIHYPPNESTVSNEKLGIGTHTDYECFTLLIQDETGGLELMNAAGKWIDAPPLDDAIIVNIGEMMSRWTNGLFAATPHRVRNHPSADRISIPFFFATNYDTEIVCLESCYDDLNPPKFEPVMAGDYLEERLNSIYGSIEI